MSLMELFVDLMVTHNGSPVRLLYRVKYSKKGEVWRVRQLFLDAPDREELFKPDDDVRKLHVQYDGV